MTNGATQTDGMPCMMMRGGTSKGAYFLAQDLPSDPAERDDLILRIVGSPDPRQIDGIGGAHPLTTKVAVISTPQGPAGSEPVDVDYLFLQPSVDQALVSAAQNCGNLLAGVGQFALERGLVTADGDRAEIRIRLVNSDSMAIARFPVVEGRPVYHGDTAIAGVPGMAAEVQLDFEDIAGANCGQLLPTGNVVDEIDGVACTLVDNGMPVVVMAAAAFGRTGLEPIAELEADEELKRRVEAIRLQAGPAMNLGDVADSTVPKMTLVGPPGQAGTVTTRSFIPHRVHEAIGVLAAVSVATAVLMADSPAADVAAGRVGDRGGDHRIGLEHPTGVFDTVIGTEDDGSISRAAIVRTARKLADGVAHPRPA